METSERELRRRDFLRTAGQGAGAIAIGSAVLPIASLLLPTATATAAAAQEKVEELSDTDLAAFAESVELAIVEAYKSAAASGKVQAAVVQVGNAFAAHHAEHAKAFATYAKDSATGKPNSGMVQAISGQLEGSPDQKAVLQILLDVENAAAATYLYALGTLKDNAALQLAATILPVEAQHAVALGQSAGKPLDKDTLPAFQTQQARVDPAKYPAAK